VIRTHAVIDVDLDIRRGEALAPMGANGAAKSKPINTLRGVHPADSGTVEIDGEAVDFRSPFEACVRTLALQLAGVETGQQVGGAADADHPADADRQGHPQHGRSGGQAAAILQGRRLHGVLDSRAEALIGPFPGLPDK
jgi:energy-coupling factor transporter ATP-binding protein EcfA2